MPRRRVFVSYNYQEQRLLNDLLGFFDAHGGSVKLHLAGMGGGDAHPPAGHDRHDRHVIGRCLQVEHTLPALPWGTWSSRAWISPPSWRRAF